MWIEEFDTSLANIWEYLASSKALVSSSDIRKSTGVPMAKVLSGLNKLAELGLLSQADKTNDQWALKQTLDAMDWARAVDGGVPLSCLEATMGLSVQDIKRVEKVIASGQIDHERKDRQAKKVRDRQNIIRGRAATRAAATDLAKIVQDAQVALAGKPSKVNDAFRSEATKALEALIKAMEKSN